MRKALVSVLLTPLAFCALFFVPHTVRAETIISPFANNNAGTQVWTKAGSPYVINGNVVMRFGSLTIEPGVVVKFNSGSTLRTHADVPTNIQGTAEEPIYFTSIKDDSVGGDDNGDGAASAPSPGDWGYFSLGGGSWNSSMQLSYVKVRYGGGAIVSGGAVDTFPAGDAPALVLAFQWFSGNPGVEYALSHIEVSHSPHGLAVYVGTNNSVEITDSSFHDNAGYGAYKFRVFNNQGGDGAGSLAVRNSWWGDPTGPFHSANNPAGLGDTVGDFIGFSPWLSTNPMPDVPESGCTENCNSSILFLPGIEGSRLYEGSEKLWEGNDNDVLNLYLNNAGDSSHTDVYTTDVIKTFDGPLDIDIYKSFLEDLEEKKTVEGVIADYAAIPYDWRLALPDILASGNEEAGGAIFYNRATSTPFIEQTLRSLAASSRTGKVTIVAHSNGGLLAKALLNQLGAEAPELVDQVILVGVPQLGTPQAVGALLHGFGADIPFQLSEKRAREFAQNAPMAYQLLPHVDYYNNVGVTITTPVVSFEPGEATQPFIDEYGSFIGNSARLHDFLAGAEGRSAPAYDDLDNPSVGNATLLDETDAFMESIGSSWAPPSGIIVHQIAGVGEDTLAGITYKTVQKCSQNVGVGNGNVICLAYQPVLSYTPDRVVDGDGTVVTPSALLMSTDNPNVHRWWINLDEYNKIGGLPVPDIAFLRTKHGNILEVEEARTFIFNNLIEQTLSSLPDYIFDSQPSISKGEHLAFVLHSPLSLSATDQAGHEISESVGTIPGASYKRYGEVQVITVPKDAFPTVHLDGVTDGSFTLEVQEYTGDTLIATTTFTGIPSFEATLASMNFPDGTLENAGNLVIDYNGDTTPDAELAPEAGKTVTLNDPSLDDLLLVLKTKVQSLIIDAKLKNKLLKKIETLEKKIAKKKEQNAKTLEKLRSTIDKKALKGKINSSDAGTLLQLLAELEAQSDMLSLDDELLTELKGVINALDAKPNIKKDLLKRVETLEKEQALTKNLSQLSATIIKKGEKGEISTTDVQELLDLLGQIEQFI